ncbi:hypothetical protein BV25DRAFT_1822091 [Artomyces pyxidatus]|uniref:Uncharacterized protein n=1 Tax=Artomyces pyxidatus TaxID=48021 RepID=A0ACB8T9X1_9AGAM|nr:hypothetical protein BV25DRAFT_1822091 [Artomyces pyxidatus]
MSASPLWFIASHLTAKYVTFAVLDASACSAVELEMIRIPRNLAKSIAQIHSSALMRRCSQNLPKGILTSESRQVSPDFDPPSSSLLFSCSAARTLRSLRMITIARGHRSISQQYATGSDETA